MTTGLLRPPDRERLAARLARDVENPVRLLVFGEPGGDLHVPGRRSCGSCEQAEALMREVAELSPKIRLEVVNVRAEPARAAEWQVASLPTIAVAPAGADSGVRFVGLPSGYEFAALAETLVSASAADGHGLREETLQKLGSLDADVDLKVFATPT